MIRLFLIIVLVVVRLLYDTPTMQDWLSLPYTTRWLLYPFVHGNWIHLIVNCLAIWVVFKPGKKDNVSALIVGAILSLAAFPFSARPCLGISNLLYGVMGYRTPPVSNPWWRKPEVLTFLAITFAMCFIPQISGTTHVVAFLLGIGIAYLRRFFNNPKYDPDRYIR